MSNFCTHFWSSLVLRSRRCSRTCRGSSCRVRCSRWDRTSRRPRPLRPPWSPLAVWRRRCRCSWTNGPCPGTAACWRWPSCLGCRWLWASAFAGTELRWSGAAGVRRRGPVGRGPPPERGLQLLFRRLGKKIRNGVFWFQMKSAVLEFIYGQH